jgi:transcriptional regulator with XRE-family HTH domain
MIISRISMGLAIRAVRDMAKLTLSALSDKTGIPISSLSRIENGLRSVDFAEALAIAEVAKIDISTLRTLAETFERQGVAENLQCQNSLKKDLNNLQRLAIEAAIASRAEFSED